MRALREAKRLAHEKDVAEAVGVFFDRIGRAEKVRGEARERAERIVSEAEVVAVAYAGEADASVSRLRALGEPVVEIAEMTGLPVSGVRAAMARAGAVPGG